MVGRDELEEDVDQHDDIDDLLDVRVHLFLWLVEIEGQVVHVDDVAGEQDQVDHDVPELLRGALGWDNDDVLHTGLVFFILDLLAGFIKVHVIRNWLISIVTLNLGAIFSFIF